jgi:hypothetical protein
VAGLATSESCFDHHAHHVSIKVRDSESALFSCCYHFYLLWSRCSASHYSTLLPFPTSCQDQCIRDQCVYITRVGPHINVIQRDLSILSCSSPEQVSELDIHSPSCPFVPFYSPFVRCIVNMAAKLLSLYLLAVACLGLVRAGTLAS